MHGDARIAEKEKEKMEKYQDLKRAITRLWNTEIYVVPVVVGALGMFQKNFNQHLKTIGATVKVELLQKAALFGTGSLLRKCSKPEAVGYSLPSGFVTLQRVILLQRMMFLWILRYNNV